MPRKPATITLTYAEAELLTTALSTEAEKFRNLIQDRSFVPEQTRDVWRQHIVEIGNLHDKVRGAFGLCCEPFNRPAREEIDHGDCGDEGGYPPNSDRERFGGRA